VSDSFVWLLLA